MIIASCTIFLLLRIIGNNQLELSNSIAALMTVIIITITSFGQAMVWTKFIAIIPAIIISILELISNFVLGFVGNLALVFIAILVIWVIFTYAFQSMKAYWEKCCPRKPSLKRMRKALYIGVVIVLLVMIITDFFF